MRFVKTVLSSSIAVAALTAGEGFAQNQNVDTSGDSRKLEVVIVTAQKRAESLQDVPISVSAVSGEKIAQMGIQRFEEAAAYIPNFTVQQDPIGDKINIRGIQSGVQAGFEQSVPIFVDGVYRGRNTQSRFAFLDVQMLEVLRGPQGTLFGNNAIAGALNITSGKPTDELEGSVRAQYNVDFKETEITGHLAGPISDSVRGRIAFLSRGLDEGWTFNSFYQEDAPEVDEFSARISLEWDAAENTLVSFKYEFGDWDNTGQPWELLRAGALSAFGLEDQIDGQSNIGNGAFGPFADDGVLSFGSAFAFEGDSEEAALTINHGLANGAEITAIAAFSAYDFQRRGDVDFNPLPAVRFDDSEDFEQTSLELRYASDTGGKLEYLGGLYYQDISLTADGLTYVGLPVLNTLVTGGCLAGGGSAFDNDVVGTLLANAASGTTAATAFNCVNQALATPLVAAGLPGVTRYALLEQDAESWAVFGQATWNFSDTVSATFGLRYLEEEKDARQSATATSYAPGSTTPTTDPLAVAASTLVLEFTEHDFGNLNRSESEFTWSANLQWDVNPDVMLYATASTGFKSGGYNSFYFGATANGGANPDEVDFDGENVLNGELGAKMSLLDGAAELNLAVFYTEYDDLQAAVFSGSTTFEVQNAAEATNQGVEIDGRIQLTEKLTLAGSLGWLDFEYDSFSSQACTDEQFVAFREAAWDGGSNPLGALAGNNACAALAINDVSGRVSANTPDFNASLSGQYVTYIGAYELELAADLNYMGSMFRQDDLDPISEVDSVLMANASLRFGPEDGFWQLAIIGKNLTDEDQYATIINDVPLFSGSHFGMIAAPRSFAIAATLRF